MEHGSPTGRALGQNQRLVQQLAFAAGLVVCVAFVAVSWGTSGAQERASQRAAWMEQLADPDADPGVLLAEIRSADSASVSLKTAATSSPVDLRLALRSERRALQAQADSRRQLASLLAGLGALLAIGLAWLTTRGRHLFSRHQATLAAFGRLRQARDAAEAQAAERQNLLRAMVASGPFGIHAFTPDGRPVLSSSTLAERHGLELPDMRRRGVRDVREFPLAEAAGIAWAFDRAAAGETVDLPAVELRVARRAPAQGEGTLAVAPLVFPVRDQAGTVTHVGLLMRDATEQQALAQRLHRAERLAAIGTLAAGVAHELNNPLTSLAMSHELLGELLEDGAEALEDQREVLQNMARSLAHIQSVTGDLAEIARPDSARASWCELAVVVDAAVQAVVPSDLEAVAVSVQLGELPPVQGSAARVEQVIQQVVENAVLATRDRGGRIVIRGRADGDDTVVVEIEDDGVGMSEADRARVFEPFFTTRPGSEGTGLGLYLVQVFLEELGGEATVRSQLDHGTTVTLRLKAAPEYTLPPSLDGLGSPSQGVRILIVSREALDTQLRELVPETAGCRRVADPALVEEALRRDGAVDVLVWDAATVGVPDRDALSPALQAQLVQLDGPEPDLKRPLDRRAVLAAVEVVIFGGLDLR
jgi:signal transduction histidine kinase